MKIKQLLIQPVNQKIGGFILSIKTYKKNWQSAPFWWQQVICMDETGEIPVDVKLGLTYNPLRGRTSVIHVIVGKIQDAEYLGKDRKKLVVDQFDYPTRVGDPGEDDIDWEIKREEEIKSKVRCWLVAASLQGRNLSREEILGWQEFVIDGEL